MTNLRGAAIPSLALLGHEEVRPPGVPVRMKAYGIYTEVNSEVGQIVVATVNPRG